jgi:DNA-directed RNA polymerase subunit alpha
LTKENEWLRQRLEEADPRYRDARIASLLLKRVGELDLGTRAWNCLQRAGIETVADLIDKTEPEIAAIPNLGVKTIAEIKEALIEQGLFLKT